MDLLQWEWPLNLVDALKQKMYFKKINLWCQRMILLCLCKTLLYEHHLGTTQLDFWRQSFEFSCKSKQSYSLKNLKNIFTHPAEGIFLTRNSIPSWYLLSFSKNGISPVAATFGWWFRNVSENMIFLIRIGERVISILDYLK